MSVRDIAQGACEGVVPSKYPDDKFQLMTGGKFAPGFGSSCGFLCHWVLFSIGCRDATILNREVPEKGMSYTPGANISRLVSGAKALNAWKTLSDGEPKLGDLVFCSNGPPHTEHVFVINSIDGKTWRSWDGGHPAADQSAPAERTRTNGALSFYGGPRTIQGWVDIELVPLDKTVAAPSGGDPLAPTSSAPTGGSGGGLGFWELALLGLAGYGAYRYVRHAKR